MFYRKYNKSNAKEYRNVLNNVREKISTQI